MSRVHDMGGRFGDGAVLPEAEDERFHADWHARALAVTPSHLGRVARAGTGGPASRLIDARLMREARRHLAYTGMRVSSIAYALGFSDLAYFSRVFTRAVGVSPRAFRARLGG